MNKKMAILTVLISISTMTGCIKINNNESDKEQENSTSVTNIEKGEKGNANEQEQLDEKITKENRALSEELKNKKLDYIDMMNKLDEEYGNVESDPNLPFGDLTGAAVETYQGYDKILNEIYQDLKIYLPKEEMEKVKAEQIKWVENKVKEEKEMKEEIGKLLPINQQLYGMTRERCYELLEYLTGGNVQQTNNNTLQNTSIDNVINHIYKSLGESKEDAEYVYSPNDNYVSDAKIKNEYYIFQVNSNIGNGDFVTLDYNILVNKNNNEIYRYTPDGNMDKY